MSIKLTWDTSTRHLDEIRSTYVHGWLGLVLFGIAAVLMHLMGYTALALVLYVSFISHLILDYTHIKAIDRKLIKVGHYLYPITIGELITDVFVFDLLMIFLILTKLI